MKRINVYWFLIIGLFLLIFVAFFVGIHEARDIAESITGEPVKCLERAGQFGDSAGFITAFFSALAFGGVIITIIWQVKLGSLQQLDLQRNHFVTVFFNMTNTLERIKDSLCVTIDKNELFTPKSTDAFELDLDFDIDESNSSENKEIDYRGLEVFYYIYHIAKTGNETFQEAISDVSFETLTDTSLLHQYFRYLYRILKYIDNSELVTEEEKYNYASILRAHLSHYELLLLFYDGLSVTGVEKLKPLLEKYSMLKNLDISSLSKTEKELYENLESLEHPEGDVNHYALCAFRHKKEYISISGRIKRAIYNTLQMCILPLLITYLFHDVWMTLIADPFLMKLPSNNPLLFIIVILCAVLYLGNLYKNRDTFNKAETLFSSSNFFAIDILIFSTIEILIHNHQWPSCGGVSYYFIIPLTAMAYLFIANFTIVMNRFRNLNKFVEK